MDGQHLRFSGTDKPFRFAVPRVRPKDYAAAAPLTEMDRFHSFVLSGMWALDVDSAATVR